MMSGLSSGNVLADDVRHRGRNLHLRAMRQGYKPSLWCSTDMHTMQVRRSGVRMAVQRRKVGFSQAKESATAMCGVSIVGFASRFRCFWKMQSGWEPLHIPHATGLVCPETWGEIFVMYCSLVNKMGLQGLTGAVRNVRYFRAGAWVTFAGEYQDEIRSTECKRCDFGTYQDTFAVVLWL